MTAQPTAALWLQRLATSDDTHGIVAHWLEQMWDSTYGGRFHFQGGKREMLSRNRPRLLDAMARSSTRLLCDPQAPEVFWAFAVVQRDMVHGVLVKRRFATEAASMLRDLLADDLGARRFFSTEMVELKACGIGVPAQWVMDPYGLGG